MKPTGIIVAAGFSSRMKIFKPLLKFKGKSFLHNIIDGLSKVSDRIVVVTGHGASLIEGEVKNINSNTNIQLVFNQNFSNGLFSSLQKGLTQVGENEWAFYHFVDQPNIHDNTYQTLASKIDHSYDWIQPITSGKRGHPILLGPKMIKLILSSSPRDNLKLISKSDSIIKNYINIDDDSILFDIDTPKDFETLTLNKS